MSSRTPAHDPLGPPFVAKQRLWITRIFGRLLAVTVDGRPMVVRCGDEMVVVDATDGAVVRVSDFGEWLAQGGFAIPHVYAGAAGPVLVTALDNQVVRQWRLPDLTPAAPDLVLARPLDFGAPHVRAVCSYRHAGRTVLLLAFQDGRVRQVDAVSMEQVAPPLAHDAEVRALATYEVAGQRRLACGDANGTLWSWDLDTGARLGSPIRPHRDWYKVIVPYELDGRTLLATANIDQSVQRIDAATGEVVGDGWYFEDTPMDMRLTRSETGAPVLAVLEGSCLWRYDARAGKLASEPIDWGEEPVEALCTVDVGGRTALFVAGESSIRRFDAATGAPWPAR